MVDGLNLFVEGLSRVLAVVLYLELELHGCAPDRLDGVIPDLLEMIDLIHLLVRPVEPVLSDYSFYQLEIKVHVLHAVNGEKELVAVRGG